MNIKDPIASLHPGEMRIGYFPKQGKGFKMLIIIILIAAIAGFFYWKKNKDRYNI
jgi:LPXTG-motif cell wall-anchored protein